MTIWTENPSATLEQVFRRVADTGMKDVPICNARLQVEALGFQQRADGHWAGAMVTPWAINLLCLRGAEAGWPDLAACAKTSWNFPSGDYEFTVAEAAEIGVYHLCSLCSPALEFESHEAARLFALAAARALFTSPIADVADKPAAVPSRRAFLGLRG